MTSAAAADSSRSATRCTCARVEDLCNEYTAPLDIYPHTTKPVQTVQQQGGHLGHQSRACESIGCRKIWLGYSAACTHAWSSVEGSGQHPLPTCATALKPEGFVLQKRRHVTHGSLLSDSMAADTSARPPLPQAHELKHFPGKCSCTLHICRPQEMIVVMQAHLLLASCHGEGKARPAHPECCSEEVQIGPLTPSAKGWIHYDCVCLQPGLPFQLHDVTLQQVHLHPTSTSTGAHGRACLYQSQRGHSYGVWRTS